MDVEGRRAFWSAIRADAEQGPDGAVRDALPGGGRPVRRPDRADAQGPHRRRRQRLGDQGAGRRAHGPGHPRAPRPRRACPGSPAWSRSRSAATPSCVHAKDTDPVARYLLNETAARDLEIASRSIEDAFLSLTGESAEDDDPEHRRTDDRRSPPMSTSTIDPSTRRVPPHGRLQPHPAADRADPDAPQPAHAVLLDGVPGGALPGHRLDQRAGTTTPATATSPPTSWSRWRCTAPR